MRGQPRDQPFHLLDRLGLRGAVLLRPALDLARHVIFAAAVIGKPDRRRIEAVQPRQRRVHGVEDLARARRASDAGICGSQNTRPSTWAMTKNAVPTTLSSAQ